MARILTRPVSKVARGLIAQQVRSQMPTILQQLKNRIRSGNWATTHNVSISFDSMRSAVELALQMPAIGRQSGTKAEQELAEAESQLRLWKRRRTVARAKVAKYGRMVRYRRKGVKP